MAIVVRRLLTDELRIANDFFNSIYKTNRSIDDFQWEFLKAPWGPAVYIVAVDQTSDKVVGTQAAIPIALENTDGDVILSAKSEDTLVDPSYRGQKIFERMYDLLLEECKKDGIRVIWGFTPAKRAFEKIGFEIPFQAQQALMVFSPGKAYRYLSGLNKDNRTIDRLKIGVLTSFSKLFSVLTSRSPRFNLRIQQVDIVSKEDVIRELYPGSNLFFVKMHNAYCKWRMVENPFENRYEGFQFFSSQTLVADVILNFRPNGLCYIEQILLREGTGDEVKRDVIRHIVSLAKPRASLVRSLLFDTNDPLRGQISLFRNCGFVVLKRGAHFVYRTLDSTDIRPTDIFLTRLFTQGTQ